MIDSAQAIFSFRKGSSFSGNIASVFSLCQQGIRASVVAILVLLLASPVIAADYPKGFDQLPERIQARWNGQLLDLEWNDLVPEGFRADAILDQYDPEKIAVLTDDDPLIQEIMGKLEEAYLSAPVVGVLDHQPVRLGGFIVPLELEQEGITEFLLVPYFGACIHVPPPPSNQILYVKTETPIAQDSLEDAVWVSGRLSVEGETTNLAQAGYTLFAEDITPIDY